MRATATGPSPSSAMPTPPPRVPPRHPARPRPLRRDEDPAAADVVERVGPLFFPRLALAERPRHLALELLPQLAQDGLVGLARAARRHGLVSHPTRRKGAA